MQDPLPALTLAHTAMETPLKFMNLLAIWQSPRHSHKVSQTNSHYLVHPAKPADASTPPACPGLGLDPHLHAGCPCLPFHGSSCRCYFRCRGWGGNRSGSSARSSGSSSGTGSGGPCRPLGLGVSQLAPRAQEQAEQGMLSGGCEAAARGTRSARCARTAWEPEAPQEAAPGGGDGRLRLAAHLALCLL